MARGSSPETVSALETWSFNFNFFRECDSCQHFAWAATSREEFNIKTDACARLYTGSRLLFSNHHLFSLQKKQYFNRIIDSRRACLPDCYTAFTICTGCASLFCCRAGMPLLDPRHVAGFRLASRCLLRGFESFYRNNMFVSQGDPQICSFL